MSVVFLGERRTDATRLSGSSNMAPALCHMGWLASCLCVCVCVVDASPNANACRLKNGTLSHSLERSTVFGPSGVSSFFLSPGRRAREMHLSTILDCNIIDLVAGNRIYEVTCFSP